jgi:hypothetical protein
MTDDAKRGALTIDDLLGLWESAVDKSYGDPIVAAGEGQGLEAFTQAMAQLSRVSTAVDTTMQAMYIRSWSGQTSPPAGGERKATVDEVVTRSAYSQWPIVLGAGLFFVEEEQTDWGVDVGESVLTGRRYTPSMDFVFEPGESGPFTVPLIAERPGWGYNNPLPKTISFIDQPGASFFHGSATVATFVAPVVGANPTPPFSSVTVTAQNQPDMFVPEHVGQYLLFTGGANAGIVARIASFISPNASLDQGSGVTLSLDMSVEFFGAQNFVVGETLELRDSFLVLQGFGRAIDVLHTAGGHTKVTFVLLNGTLPTSPTIVGQQSAVTAAVDTVLSQPAYVAEVSAASWRILDWAFDLGVVASNPKSPLGGQLGLLDELGAERNVFRAPGEDDDSYRERVSTIADVVTPNAIRRALNKSIGPLWCLRETGLSAFPGFFLDHDALDYTMTKITGAITGTFIDGEPVQQIVSGVIAFGIARTRTAAAVGPLPAPPGAETFQGFVVKGRTPFVTGTVITGLVSGATVTPASITQGPQNRDRFKLIMGYLEFRAYMFIGVRPANQGEFGFAFDAYPTGAFDAAPYSDFFDGYPTGAAFARVRASQAIDKIRAGGVGFEFYEETGPCP